MDIIGCRFQEVIDQQKKHMRRVSNVYRERVRSIKTVLFFIVSVSLLSGETVPTASLAKGQISGEASRTQSFCGSFKYKLERNRVLRKATV